MEIEFILTADDRLLKTGEDFYFYLSIIVNLKNKVNQYKQIKIDKTSLRHLSKHIHQYLNKEIAEIDYSPLEEHFWLFQKKGKLNELEMNRVIDDMERLDYDKLTINELRYHPSMTKLILLIDNEYAEEHGNSTRTGEAFIINVTDEVLNDFVSELELFIQNY